MGHFIQRLAASARQLYPAVLVGALVIAIADASVRLVSLGWWEGGMGTFLLVLWWGMATITASAVIIATVALAVLSPLFFVGANESQTTSVPHRTLAWCFGSTGDSFPVDAVFLIAMALSFALALNLPEWVGLAGEALQYALTLARIAAVGAVWIVYRIALAGGWIPAGHRWVLLAFTLGLAYELIHNRGTFLAPHHIHWALPFLFMLAAAMVGSATERKDRLARWVARVGTTAVILSLPVPFLYSAATLAHAELMHRPILIYPARTLVGLSVELDGDGEAAVFDGLDCDDLDPARNFSTFEIPGNGIDDNCVGGDLEIAPPRDSAPHWAWKSKTYPPVIMITIDTIRADHVMPNITPTLWQLRKNAFSFSRAYSVSTHTDEAIPAALTGRYPHTWHQQGVYFGIDPTIPEVLGDFGYQTIGVLTFPWVVPPVIHGLQVVDNSLGAEMVAHPNAILSRRATSLALEYVDRRERAKPLFLWVHYYDPHAPVGLTPVSELPPGAPPSYGTDLYAADQGIAALLDGLRSRGILKDAVVVIFGDHGEGLGEHGVWTHAWGAYDSITRVPFIVSAPGIAPGETDRSVSIVSLFPTLLDLLQIEGGRPFDGPSLAPLFRGIDVASEPFFIEANLKGGPLLRAVVDGRWKLIFDVRRQTYQLFDLDTDAGELENLIRAEPDRFHRLRTELWNWWDAGYNERLLDRKKRAWDARGQWTPSVLVGEELMRSVSGDGGTQ